MSAACGRVGEDPRFPLKAIEPSSSIDVALSILSVLLCGM